MRYEIHAIAEGSATLHVEAESEDEAEKIAYRDHLTGIIIEGGEATWTIESVEEAS